jgi:macrodomain Ter protein organizer (MatP/YcbG family)
MKRTQIYLTDREWKILKRYSKKVGITLSESIRRILDKYLKDYDNL